MTRIVNSALYQVGWFCCVLGAANERPWLGSIAAGALIVVHVAWVTQPLGELKLLLEAVQFPAPAARSLIVLGVVWASALPFLLWLASRWIEAESPGNYRGLGKTGKI